MHWLHIMQNVVVQIVFYNNNNNNSCHQRATGFDATRWHHHLTVVEGQATSMGRNSSRHVRRCTRGEHRQRGRSCSQSCISQQEQVQPAIQHPHFLPSGYRHSGHLALPGGRIDKEIGRRTANITGNARETTYLFQ